MVISGRTLSELPCWLGNTIVSAIQQLEEESRAKEGVAANVQILVEAINECKLKFTTVAKEGEGNTHLFTDELDRERWRR